RRLDVLHPARPRRDRPGGEVLQHLPRDGTARDTTDGLSRARAAASLPVPDPVLGFVGVVGVRGTVDVAQLLVGARARVGVADEDCDRGAEGLSLEDPREDLGAVGLLSRRRQATLAGPPAIELLLEVLRGQRDAGRTAVDDDAHAPSVRLPEGADAEQMAEGRAHAAIIPPGAAKRDAPVARL